MQLRVSADGSAAWYSRNGNDWTERLTDFDRDASLLSEGVYDGEMCVLNAAGAPDFSALRAAMGRRQAGKIVGDLTFFAFDMLMGARGEDLRAHPLADRRTRLEAAISDDAVHCRLAGDLPGGGSALLEAACRMGLEGIVSKRLDAPYEAREGRRAETWVKAKCRPAQEVVVGGWEMHGPRFRSLLVGVWENDAFRFVGAIGTGFSAKAVSDLLPRLRAVEAERSPFNAGSPPRASSSIHWTRPELVAAAEIAEWTAADQLRQASYKGLREDKPARSVVRERPGPGTSPT